MNFQHLNNSYDRSLLFIQAGIPIRNKDKRNLRELTVGGAESANYLRKNSINLRKSLFLVTLSDVRWAATVYVGQKALSSTHLR